jgi:hypothetical protein
VHAAIFCSHVLLFITAHLIYFVVLTLHVYRQSYDTYQFVFFLYYVLNTIFNNLLHQEEKLWNSKS